MDVENLLKEHGVDYSERPDPTLEYCCSDCATFYSIKTAPHKELKWSEGRGLGYTELRCDCHGNEKVLDMAVELNINTPAMEWEKEWLELIHTKLEKKAEEVERLLNMYYDC